MFSRATVVCRRSNGNVNTFHHRKWNIYYQVADSWPRITFWSVITGTVTCTQKVQITRDLVKSHLLSPHTLVAPPLAVDPHCLIFQTTTDWVITDLQALGTHSGQHTETALSTDVSMFIMKLRQVYSSLKLAFFWMSVLFFHFPLVCILSLSLSFSPSGDLCPVCVCSD